MVYRYLTKNELENTVVGEAISLTTIMAVAAIMVMVVVIFKLYSSSKGTTTIPGGWKFTWN